MRLSCAVQLAAVVLVAHVQATQGLSWGRFGGLNIARQVNPTKTSTTTSTRRPSTGLSVPPSPGGTTSSRPSATRPSTTRPTTTTTSTTRRTTSTSTTSRPPPSSTGEDETESPPPPDPTTTSSQDGSSSRSLESQSSIVETTSTSDSSYLPEPIPSASETTTSDGRQQEPASQSPDPTAFAENRSILHNKTASALIFTFTALVAIAVVGLLLYCCFWRRRQQHILLSDGDSDGHAGILRANSTGSRSSGTRRPMSAVSVFSEGHYLPARFAGVPPINRQYGFDTAHIENDPYSVHRVVYPDPPGPSSDGHESRRSYTLYPDPVPPPMPIRVVPPRPAQPLAAIIAAAGISTAPPPAEPRSSPTRVKVPALPQSLSGSSQGHGYDSSDPHDSVRAQSPDSHYDDDGVYQSPPRTFLIDRRPDTSKRRSQ